MIYAAIMSKGGVGKSTLCFNLAHSAAFQEKFKKICLVEIDAQGSLYSLTQSRIETGLPALVDFLHLDVEDPEDLKQQIESVKKTHDCLIIDSAGEGLSGVAAQYVLMSANRVLIPTRTTALDERALTENMFPLIKRILQKAPHRKGCYSVIPSMVNPRSDFNKVLRYFEEYVIPDWIELCRVVIVNRAVLENFNRDGSTLHEYKNTVKGNKYERSQAEKAIADIERIAQHLTREVK